MRKYTFRQGDTVKERTAYGRPIIGRVIGCSSSQEHDYYKIASRGDVYNARDDELELVRRGPAKPGKFGLVDQYTLDWYGPDENPAAGEVCMIAWIGLDGEWRQEIVKWTGEEWQFAPHGDLPGVRIGMDCVDAWAPWEWPELAKPESGEEGEERDGSADPND